MVFKFFEMTTRQFFIDGTGAILEFFFYDIDGVVFEINKGFVWSLFFGIIVSVLDAMWIKKIGI